MARSNYHAICEEHRRDYSPKAAQKTGRLAADRYNERTHFIFELLQNAEDALGRRHGDGPRKVTFELAPTRLKLSHYGQPFSEADVRSVCDFLESTKDDCSIGRFGIGFKSVYTVTDRPEIHSGDEDFAIEDYIFPKETVPTSRSTGETQIVLPLREGDDLLFQQIAAGLQRLGPRVLQFLRHIDEIDWSVEGGASCSVPSKSRHSHARESVGACMQGPDLHAASACGVASLSARRSIGVCQLRA